MLIWKSFEGGSNEGPIEEKIIETIPTPISAITGGVDSEPSNVKKLARSSGAIVHILTFTLFIFALILLLWCISTDAPYMLFVPNISGKIEELPNFQRRPIW